MQTRCPVCGYAQEQTKVLQLKDGHAVYLCANPQCGAELYTAHDLALMKSLRIDSEQEDIEAVRKADENRWKRKD